MYSSLVRLLYAASCLPIFSLIGELILLFWHKDKRVIYWDGDILDGILNLVSYHWPMFILALQVFFSYTILNYAKKHLPSLTVTVRSKKNPNFVANSMFSQVVPVITFCISHYNLLGDIFGKIVIALIVILTILSTMKYGIINPTIWFTHSQYKVSSNSAEYLLISKRKIYDFTRSIEVVEISENVLLKL